MEGNSALKELIMDDEEDMTLGQLASGPIGKNNDASTGVLSMTECNMEDSAESDKLNEGITSVDKDMGGYEDRKMSRIKKSLFYI